MKTRSTIQDEAKRCMKEHRWLEAIVILQDDIRENAKGTWSPMYLGSCYYELREFQTALDWFRHVEGLEPNNPTAIGLQGDALHCLGCIEEAQERYRRALEIAPNDELAAKNWTRFSAIKKEADQVVASDGDNAPV